MTVTNQNKIYQAHIFTQRPNVLHKKSRKISDLLCQLELHLPQNPIPSYCPTSWKDQQFTVFLRLHLLLIFNTLHSGCLQTFFFNSDDLLSENVCKNQKKGQYKRLCNEPVSRRAQGFVSNCLQNRIVRCLFIYLFWVNISKSRHLSKYYAVIK